MTRLALLAAVLAIAGCSADSKPAAVPARPSMTDPNLRDDAKRAAMTPPTGGKMDMEKK